MYIDVEDIERTTFIINKGSYCYMVMPYGYKKKYGKTYQEDGHLYVVISSRKTMEVNINVMLFKTRDELH